MEGIDELAVSHGPAVAELTAAAMRGEVALQDVYARRLDIVRPTREQVSSLGEGYIAAIVPDARETLNALRSEGVAVRVISGGLRPAVISLARSLEIPEHAVWAVDVSFHPDGAYAGFDPLSPLARSGGKGELVGSWTADLERPVMMVGDGVTDLEVRPHVDLFVAFAGVTEREAVVKAADIVIRAKSLAPVVAIALGGEPPRDPAARRVFEKGMTLMEKQSR